MQVAKPQDVCLSQIEIKAIQLGTPELDVYFCRSKFMDYLDFCLSVLESKRRVKDVYTEGFAVKGASVQDVLKAAYIQRLKLLRSTRVNIKACQKLSKSAPVERIMLGKRTKRLFVARPPIAPPFAA
jgi:hypothetical protein